MSGDRFEYRPRIIWDGDTMTRRSLVCPKCGSVDLAVDDLGLERPVLCRCGQWAPWVDALDPNGRWIRPHRPTEADPAPPARTARPAVAPVLTGRQADVVTALRLLPDH